MVKAVRTQRLNVPPPFGSDLASLEVTKEGVTINQKDLSTTAEIITPLPPFFLLSINAKKVSLYQV